MEQTGKADPTAMGQPGTEGNTPVKKKKKNYFTQKPRQFSTRPIKNQLESSSAFPCLSLL